MAQVPFNTGALLSWGLSTVTSEPAPKNVSFENIDKALGFGETSFCRAAAAAHPDRTARLWCKISVFFLR